MSTRIAFIGLGNMGGPMARNLAAAGSDVAGFDLSESSCKLAADGGIRVCSSAAEAAENAEIIITMLPAGHHLLSVWQDVTRMVKPGTLLIDCSTVDVDSSRKAHDVAQASGCLSLDAPVSGGTKGATEGTLTFMVGGTEQAFSRGAPFLQVMGARIVHCGDAGAGQAAKICNNMILGISMLGVSEAFVLAEKLGLSAQALFDVASTSSGQCWALTSYCPIPGPVATSPANNGYRPGFAASLMLKDMKLAQQAAAAAGVSTPLGAMAAQIYTMFDAAGRGGEDFPAVVRFLRGHEQEEA